jgi:hypothetical protein
MLKVALILLLAMPALGMQYVGAHDVALNLWARDADSGVAIVEIWEGILPVLAMAIVPPMLEWTQDQVFRVSDGDGLKTIYVRYTDGAGNVSETYSIDVYVDTVPPIGGIEYLALPGDINSDGRVDFADFNILRANWGRENLGG